MKLAKEFRRQSGITLRNPNISATSASNFLSHEWNASADVVNELQSGVVLYGQSRVLGTLIPPSFIYEYHRLNPTTLYSDPVIHVTAQDFKKDFYGYVDDLDMYTSLVVTNKKNMPLFGFVSDVHASGMLELNDEHKVVLLNRGEEMFCAPESNDMGSWSVHDTIKLSKSDKSKIFQAIDILNEVEKNRDVMHDAIRNLRFDIA